MMINFEEQPKFSKELKQLAKKYRSLPDDFAEFKKVLAVRPLGAGKHFNVITRTETVDIVKARLFCKYLKGSSLRIIYAFFPSGNKIEFIELYFKSDKANEDGERIKEFLKNLH